MITSNDLFDLYYSFLLIRHDIKYELNSRILEEISKIVLAKCDDDNSIRKGLAVIYSLDLTKWNFVHYNNLYTYRELVKDEKTLLIIAKMCQILKELIEAGSFEQAYDFVDAIHYIPILIQKGKSVRLKTIKKLTKSYRKKWGMLDLS